LAILLTFVTAVPRAHAQSSTVSQAVLDAAVQEHLASVAAERAAVVRVLQQPEVRTLAGRFGVDLRTAQQAVATIDGAELRALSAQASQVEQALAGGQSKVVISTTTIIIGLLVLILLIVALR
jgi:DNA-binding GntR family transcriptional regulator